LLPYLASVISRITKMSSPTTIRWGILATGGIAATFTKDLLIDPHTRGVSDIKHVVVAAASSSSADRAKKFLEECKVPAGAAAYGSYDELVKDPNVDVIYVATPHSHHYQNTMLCLEAGKNVLCEKAFTTNAAQAKKLVETAKTKNLFLMEAVWTRYFPISIAIRKIIESGAVGPVHRAVADLSFGEDIDNKWGPEHRMVNPNLAGGALLDLGIYALTWVFQTLYHTVPPAKRQAPSVLSSISKYKTGTDEMTSMLLTFPSAPGGVQAHGVALTGMRVATDPDGLNSAGPAVRVQGTKGEIDVDGPLFRPTKFRVVPKAEDFDFAKVKELAAAATKTTTLPGTKVLEFEFDIPGHGMFWEADEAARCVRDGKKQSETLSWEESVVIMEVMDTVRKQNDFVYPQKIETLDYPVKLD